MKSWPIYLLVFSQTCGATLAMSADWPQWRGMQRNGKSTETGLLKEWPQEGPKLVWSVNDAGFGYGAPAVVGKTVYLLGNESPENEFVQAREVGTGKLLWKTRLGNVGNPKQSPNFPAARSTPTVEGDFLYVLSSDGDLAKVESVNGKIAWKKSLREDFGGKPGTWAYSESPLLDGNTLVCTPGGSQATLVALNKATGDVIWKCATPEGDEAAYASVIIVEAGGARQYVQLLSNGLVGVDAKTGKFQWRYAKATSAYKANIPTPLAYRGMIYVGSAGTGGGAVKVRDGATEVEQLYFNNKLPTAIGGIIQVDDFFYGTTGKGLQCVNFATGEMKWDEPSIKAGSMCFADGKLYVHGEAGEVVMAEASPEKYVEKGRFSPPDRPKKSNQMEKSWAYPAIADGRLYLRDHGMLWCYAVK